MQRLDANARYRHESAPGNERATAHVDGQVVAHNAGDGRPNLRRYVRIRAHIVPTSAAPGVRFGRVFFYWVRPIPAAFRILGSTPIDRQAS
jgi:hypothetical protein